jgi:hypothetical protein
MFAAVLILGVGSDPAPPTFEVVNKVPPAFQVTNRVPPPAVAAQPRPVPPAGRWVVEEWPGYGRVEVWRETVVTTTSGVVVGPRPFSAPGSTAPPTKATAAPAATTSPPTTAGGPRTTAPFASKAATPTALIPTSAQPVAPAGSSPAGGTKFLVSERTDELGNKWQYYSDGSVTICSAFG